MSAYTSDFTFKSPKPFPPAPAPAPAPATPGSPEPAAAAAAATTSSIGTKRAVDENDAETQRIPQLSFTLGSYARSLTIPLITLVVGPKTAAVRFTVHSSILTKIPFFNAALNGKFKEAETKIMHLPEDTPEIMAKLIEYLYTGKYTVDQDYLPSTEKEFAASRMSAVGTPPFLSPTKTFPRHLLGSTSASTNTSLGPLGAQARDFFSLGSTNTSVNTSGSPDAQTRKSGLLSSTNISINKSPDVQARNKYNLKVFHSCVFLLAEKYDVPGLLSLSASETRAVSIYNEWEMLEYWLFVYEFSGPQSALRIANNLSGDLRGTRFSYDIKGMKEWILRLWAGDGGAKGSRNEKSKFLECLRESPELARDCLVLIAGAIK